MDFAQQSLQSTPPQELRLSVTRTWGNRTLSTKSAAWRSLRKKIMDRDNNTCTFCGLSSSKHMVCDHANGDASDNSQSNLRVLCPLCDLIRHCGLAGIYKNLYLYKSQLPQVDIVKKSVDYFRKTRCVPKPEEIDPDAIFIEGDTINFANVLLLKDYEELSKEQKLFKGFFAPNSKTHFENVIN